MSTVLKNKLAALRMLKDAIDMQVATFAADPHTGTAESALDTIAGYVRMTREKFESIDHTEKERTAQ